MILLAVMGCGGQTVITAVVTPTPGPTPAPIIQTVIVTATPGPTPAREIRTNVVTPTPGPSPALSSRVVVATPTPTSATSAPTDAASPLIEPGLTPKVELGLSAVQEIGIIENYAANRFWSQHILVIKDIPVRLYLTRLHREHDNRFSIEPFYSTSEVILPGEVGVMEFVPDRVGEFKIRNIGHGAEADLIVVATAAEARSRIEERGIQMYALIHDVDEFRMYPETLVVQKDIFVAIHNINRLLKNYWGRSTSSWGQR